MVPDGLGTKTRYVSNSGIYGDEIWNRFFRVEKFKGSRGFIFDNQIMTDGVGATVLLKKKITINNNNNNNNENEGEGEGEGDESQERYIDELSVEEMESFQTRNLVAIDPNMRDLLVCYSPVGVGVNNLVNPLNNDNHQVNGRAVDLNHLQNRLENAEEIEKKEFIKYSNNQRIAESKSKKINKLIENLRKNHYLPTVRSFLSDYESAALSPYSCKTLDFQEYRDRIYMKNLISAALRSFYNQEIFRRLRLSKWINTNRSERKFINRFSENFGGPNEVVIGIGDWAQKKNRKFFQPVKGVGFRKMFRKYGYKIFLVDESKTSSRCSRCQDNEAITSTFKYCVNPDKRKRNVGPLIKRHGLVKCSSCHTPFCRDKNACKNIYNIMEAAVMGLSRPEYLKRAIREDDDDDDNNNNNNHNNNNNNVNPREENNNNQNINNNNQNINNNPEINDINMEVNDETVDAHMEEDNDVIMEENL